MKTYPTAVLDAMEAGRLLVRFMIRFDLDGGSAGLWNDTYPLTHGGVVFDPLAGNLIADDIPGHSELSSESVKVSITNLLSAVTEVLANEDWHQRPCVLSVAFLNDDGTVLFVDPVFSGFLDDATLSDASDDLNTLGLVIESSNRELNRSSGATRNDAGQRKRSITDGFFKHAATANADTEIYWGRKGPQSPTRSSRD